MSQPKCSACTDIREYAPLFVSQGVSDTVATSLKNNHGLNHALSTLHNNCEDLNDVNDCLIGRKVQEIESLDVCDWKEFMEGFGPNLYETLKAIIASDCGQWEMLTTLCTLINNVVAPDIGKYGILPNTYGDNNPSHRGGQLEGGWLQEVPSSEATHGSTWRNSAVGIRFEKFSGVDCDGVDRTYVWYCPVFINHMINPATPRYALLWSVDKPTAMAWGVPEAFWQAYTVSNWTWAIGYSVSADTGFLPIRVRLWVDPATNRLGVYYVGTLIGASIPADNVINTDDAIERVTKF